MLYAKLAAAIEAVEIRGARPRKDDRRTIEAIIWRLDNGAKWRSIPGELGNWHDVAHHGPGRCLFPPRQGQPVLPTSRSPGHDGIVRHAHTSA